MIKVLIVDDELKARNILHHYIVNFIPQITEVRQADSVDAALNILKDYSPGIVFLDVEMPFKNGFDLCHPCYPWLFLPYNSVSCLRRAANSSFNAPVSNRQAQFPSVLFGRFMRASVPRPSRSCKGTIAVFATEARTPRMKSQWISSPFVFR